MIKRSAVQLQVWSKYPARTVARGLVTAILCLEASAALADDVHVDINNTTGVEDGSALRPYHSIQAAIDAAQTGDRILVAVGTFPGPLMINSKELDLLGSFKGGSAAEYAALQGGDFSEESRTIHETIVTGAAASAVVSLVEAGASRVENFTLTGGRGARFDEYRTQGGGVYIDGGAPHIVANRVEANDARNPEQENFGGGIYSGNSDSTIEGNLIVSNQAGRGAGIAVSGGRVVIRNNTIEANLADGDHGGGIYAFCENILIEDNVVRQNEVGRDLGYGWGGGIIVFNPGASAVMRRNLVHHNFAPSRGAGVFIDEGAIAVMEHCIVYANHSIPESGAGGVYVDVGPENLGSRLTMRHCVIAGHRTPDATVGGNALFVEQFCTATVENSILWDNDGSSVFQGDPGSVTIRYSTTEETVSGPGNITTDPLFAAPELLDFHLKSTAGRWNVPTSGWVIDPVSSPAIDAGDPESPFQFEPDGNGGRVNQGAYGNTGQASRTSLPTPSGFLAW